MNRLGRVIFSGWIVFAIGLGTILKAQDGIDIFSRVDENALTAAQANRLNRLKNKATSLNARVVALPTGKSIKNLISADAIQLEMMPGEMVEIDRSRINSYQTGEYSWVGKPREANAGDYVIISVFEDQMLGIMAVTDHFYSIEPLGSNAYAIMEADVSKMGQEHPPAYPSGYILDGSTADSSRITQADFRSLGKTAGAQSIVTHNYDLMVLYTEQGKDAAGGKTESN